MPLVHDFAFYFLMLTRGTRTRTPGRSRNCVEVPPVSISKMIQQCVDKSNGKLGYSLLPDQVVRSETAAADDLSDESDEFCFKYCVLDLDWSHSSPVKSYKIHDTSDTIQAWLHELIKSSP